MNNILSFAQSEFRTFDELPFGEVDSLILSWLSYIQWPIPNSQQTIKDTFLLRDMLQAEHFPTMFSGIKDKEPTKELLIAVLASPRYRTIRLWDYEADTDLSKEKQFAAMTFRLNEKLDYVAYRGTDSTFVGWKEDLNMAFQYPVPSQEAAVGYLHQIATASEGTLLVGGHSKGGNLAICAAANNHGFLDRIESIYSHDSPGFLKEVIDSLPFLQIRNKIRKTVPQSSIIGMLLEQHENYRIVRSTEKGFGQHNPFSWTIEDGSFCSMDELTADAANLNHVIDDWLESISIEERSQFVDAVYMLSENIDVDNFLDFGKELPSNIPKVIESFSNLDKETRDMMMKIISSLAGYYLKSIPEEMRNLGKGSREEARQLNNRKD